MQASIEVYELRSHFSSHCVLTWACNLTKFDFLCKSNGQLIDDHDRQLAPLTAMQTFMNRSDQLELDQYPTSSDCYSSPVKMPPFNYNCIGKLNCREGRSLELVLIINV